MCAVPRRVVLCSRGSGFSLTLAKVQAWSPPKFEILLFLKARKLAVGAAVHHAQSGFLSNFLDFEFATTAGAWIGIFRNCLGAFLTSAESRPGPAELNFRIRRVREWNDAALRPASCGDPGNGACPLKRKKATKMGRGRMPRALATSPRRRPRALPRRPTSCCCSSASPRFSPRQQCSLSLVIGLPTYPRIHPVDRTQHSKYELNDIRRRCEEL